MSSLYTYDKAGRLTQANMKVGGTPRCVDYAYDRNGNMTWDANRGVHMQWDANNRLVCAYYNPGVLSFTRSATGRRLSRSYSPNQSVVLEGGTIKKNRSLEGYPRSADSTGRGRAASR